jgi:hypothetical protein
MGGVIDCDQHLFESRTMWQDHADPADRDDALALTDDELGHTWLMWRGRRLSVANVPIPGEPDDVGAQAESIRAGERAPTNYDELLPREYWDPDARLPVLDGQGLDAAVLFPNYGLIWERDLEDDLHATRVNMAAWNRWATTVQQQGRGRLRPVAHLTLRDFDFLDAQLAALDAADVRLAMISPGLVEGKPLSHPELDRAWSAFVAHGVTPVFHVANQTRPFDDAWFASDPEPSLPVLSSVFLWTGAALALSDLVLNGVFSRHPELRIGVMELSAVWVPMFSMYLDGGYDFHRRMVGRGIVELDGRPSDIVRDHARIAAFAYERPDALMGKVGDLFMACSDYPHAEGTATPREDYGALSGPASDPTTAPGLYGENLEWLTSG